MRGAVPIIFAIFILAENVPHASLIFNIVFFCTLVSLLIQGTSLPIIAKWLGLADKPQPSTYLADFDIDFSDEIKSVTSEITISDKSLINGNLMMDLSLPDKTLAVMVKRGDHYFIPRGNTKLIVNDKLLIITDDMEALNETYRNMGVDEV